MSAAPTVTPRKKPTQRPKSRTGRVINLDDEEKPVVKPLAAALDEEEKVAVKPRARPSRTDERSKDGSDLIKKSDRSARIAFAWFRDDADRFDKYRNYMTTHDAELAAEIRSQCHGKRSKADVAEWVLANVGFVPDTDTRAVTIKDIVDIAIVAAGLTRHGVESLEREYDAGRMDSLQNVYYHTYDLRKNESQQELRKQSKSKSKDDKHAAHYVGLDVGLQLNNALPPGSRVDGDVLRDALNMLKNMRLVSATTNLGLHKQVDKRLLDVDDHGTLRKDEYDRLKQIAKHAQSDEFQQAMAEAANGRNLYLALRDRLSSFDVRGEDRLWDGRKDRRDLQRPSTAPKPSRQGKRPS